MSGSATQFTNLPAYVIDVWNGLADGPTSWWSAASSGHGIWENATFKLELAANAPAWVMVHAASKFADVTKKSPYYKDGLPTSRHTYYSTQFIKSRNRVMLFGVGAPYGVGDPTNFEGGPQVDGFDVSASRWDAAGTWPNQPMPNDYAQAVARDPNTDDIYVGAGTGTFAKWSCRHGNMVHADTDGFDVPARVAGIRERHRWQAQSMAVSARRCSLCDDGGLRFQVIDLATRAMTEVPVSGLPRVVPYSALVHDTDNDRYLLAAGTELYSISPTTFAATKIGNLPAPTNGTFNRFAYFPALGGVAYLPNFSSNVLFMPTR